ncbi:MAG: DUF6484 domain-containing protein [Vicinamibacterales bacterium]
MRTKETTVDVFPVQVAEAALDTTAAQVATIVSLTVDGTPNIRLDAASPVVPARWAMRVTRERIETAIVLCQQVVVLFENGDRARPLIIGFVESGFIEALEPQSPERVTRPDTLEGMPVIEADVDGRRVRLTAQDEIVLQCGSASVTLRRNGRVVIRGTYVETQSEGTNRIKGGQVQIN